MSERISLLRSDLEWVSLDLSGRAAAMAMRVAALLEETCSAESGAAEAAAFFRSWAGSAADRRGLRPSATPFDALVNRFRLSEADCDLLMLSGLPEEHEGLASTFRALHPRGESYPTVGLAALVLGDGAGDRASFRRLLCEGVAVGRGLVRLAGDGTFFERTLRPAERLWDVLHGHDAWPAMVERVHIGPVPAGLGRWLDLPAVRCAVEALRSPEPRTLLVTSLDETVALSRCAAMAAAAGVALAGGRVTTENVGVARLIAGHAAARGAVPVLVIASLPDAGSATPPDLDLRGIDGAVVVCAPSGAFRPAGDRPALPVPIGPVSTGDHRAAWKAAMPDLADQAPLLAARHPLDPALTARVAADVRSQQRLVSGAVGLPDISGVIRARAGVVLPAGVILLSPAVPWDRLILPAEPGRQLRDAVARLEYQSLVLDDWEFRRHARADRGVRLLFTGPPGTGKSLAAEVVATAAGTDLLAVDVSRVVSKWIGETEKNLSAIFDVAERTQAVLCFGEADSLFGKRTEISDAHDRYANLETAYLLQRLDNFDGLAVLATNLRQNIDPAFVRRMDFVIEFAVPDEACRRDLWALHLPERVRAADVDFTMLARLYPVPGGWIRNAAIAAGFLAASEPAGAVHQTHLVSAVRREYAKATRPFPGEPPSLHRDGGHR